MTHKDKSPLAGRTVKIKAGEFSGQDYRVEDWWDRLGQGSWKWCKGNPACLEYAFRSALEAVTLHGGLDPFNDDEVLYGKIGMFGKLIHSSQVEHE